MGRGDEGGLSMSVFYMNGFLTKKVKLINLQYFMNPEYPSINLYIVVAG
jgi:hypothetical protein